MAEEKLIKSNRRVKEHGEVFTPKRVVQRMLDQPEISSMVNSLTTTFLEPAAGEGAFLTEILSRKLKLAATLSESIQQYEQNSLITLTTLYGIELLADNVELLVMHMYRVFHQLYVQELSVYDAPENRNVEKSALIIIEANMVQGDAITGKNQSGNSMVFSQWTLLPKHRGVQNVQRTEYTLEAIKTNGPSLDGQLQKHGSEEISLFELEDVEDEQLIYKYRPVKLQDVYKECKTLIK